ncbi:MAG TPA: hypothetical protein VML19_06435 [Verrucomicrobiae bacterium]|nr:hypothetical protein [Verrucomicrobiae bacterium]
MTRFEELQQIWQNQPQPREAAVELEIRGAMDALRRFGRRQYWINGFKLACMVFQAWYCLSKFGVTLGMVAGEAIFLAGLGNLLLADWRNQMDIARLDFSSPSFSFIEEALERLRNPNAGYRERLGFNLTLVCVGYNIMALTRVSEATLAHRLAVQLLATTLMLVASYTLGLKLHAKRCELEYRPIKTRLMEMKQALEDSRQ